VTTPTSERWRSRWPTQEAAQKYLRTITDLTRRGEMAAFLGLELPSYKVNTDFPPLPPMQVMRFTPVPETVPGNLTLFLRWGPSINHYWRHVLIRCKPGKPGTPPYRVQVMISAEGRQYRKAVLENIQKLREHQPHSAPPGARLAVTLTLFPPNRRAIDIDNRIKAVLDALTHAEVWADDSLIDELTVVRGEVVKGGQIRVTITPLTSTLFEASQ